MSSRIEWSGTQKKRGVAVCKEAFASINCGRKISGKGRGKKRERKRRRKKRRRTREATVAVGTKKNSFGKEVVAFPQPTTSSLPHCYCELR